MQQQREKHESQLGSRFTFLALLAATQREMRLGFRVQSQSQSRNWDVAGVGAGAGAGQQQLLRRTPNTGSRRAGERREVKALSIGLPRAQWAEGYGKLKRENI